MRILAALEIVRHLALEKRGFPPGRFAVMRGVVERATADHDLLVSQAQPDNHPAEQRRSTAGPRPAPLRPLIAAMRMPDRAELADVFGAARGNESVEQRRLVRVTVLDRAWEGLDHLVDGHEVPAEFGDAAASCIVAAAEALQIIPDAGRIGDDDQPPALVFAGDRRQRHQRAPAALNMAWAVRTTAFQNSVLMLICYAPNRYWPQCPKRTDGSIMIVKPASRAMRQK